MQTLDVVIGMVFVYLLLSLVCTAANELLAQWLNSRATTLKQGIEALLVNTTRPLDKAALAMAMTEAEARLTAIENDARTAAGSAFGTWTDAVYAAETAALVVEQACARERLSEARVSASAASAAEVIPELAIELPESPIGVARAHLQRATVQRGLATAALNTIRPGFSATILEARDAAARARAMHGLATFYDHPLIAGLSQLRWRAIPFRGKVKLPSYIPTPAFTLAVIDVIAPASSSSPTPLLEVRRALATLPEHARRPLLLILNQSRGDLTVFRASLSAWFDNTMERVSGLYKRKTKASVLLFAIGVTLSTNANTVTIVRALSTDAALRNAIVARAKDAVDAPEEIKRRIAGDTNATEAELRTNVSSALADVQSLGIPMGYKISESHASLLEVADLFSERTVGTGASAVVIPSKLSLYWDIYVPQILSGLVGLLITTLALSLGAPFWFDMLNKVVNVRAVGRTPAENARIASNKS